MSAIPDAFKAKKQKILESLSIPDEEYTDLSPKGSVDVGIRDLIDEINAIDGLVTTSSCAGRISVFLEGTKHEAGDPANDELRAPSSQAAVPGGKGMGGRWLFVSHDPVPPPSPLEREENSVMEMFGLSRLQHVPENQDPQATRFVKFQFEPMVIAQLCFTYFICPRLKML